MKKINKKITTRNKLNRIKKTMNNIRNKNKNKNKNTNRDRNITNKNSNQNRDISSKYNKIATTPSSSPNTLITPSPPLRMLMTKNSHLAFLRPARETE